MMSQLRIAGLIFASALLPFPSPAADTATPTLIIRHARVFDGRNPQLQPDRTIIVSGNQIVAIRADTADNSAIPESVRVIDAGGRVVIPGLIDAHVHTTIVSPVHQLREFDPSYLTARSAVEARATLMRGFTTVRDMAGPSFGLKQAIDEGLLEGPRIFPSGAMISQTSGHGDFRHRSATPGRRWTGQSDTLELNGYALIADGPDEVAAAVREQLRLGASQIKLAAGGGVSSSFDPLDSVQYFDTELRAAVQAASDWGTYVAVHAYTPTAIRRSVEAGVRSIEHGQLIDEPTMKLIAERGVYLSTQAYLFGAENPVGSQRNALQQAKALLVAQGLDRSMQLAKKYHVKIVFGTDLFGSPKIFAGQSREFGARLQWFTSVEILQQATSINGDLLALSGKRNLYGRVGVIEEGALADLLIVDGNPLDDIRILEQPERSLSVIIKDGRVVKNELGVQK